MQGKGTDVIRKPIITTMYVRKHLHRVRAFSPARTFDDLSLGAVHNLSGDPRHQRHTYSPLPSPPLSPFPFPPRRAACIITVLVDFGRLSPYGHANDCMTLPLVFRSLQRASFCAAATGWPQPAATAIPVKSIATRVHVRPTSHSLSLLLAVAACLPPSLACLPSPKHEGEVSETRDGGERHVDR